MRYRDLVRTQLRLSGRMIPMSRCPGEIFGRRCNVGLTPKTIGGYRSFNPERLGRKRKAIEASPERMRDVRYMIVNAVDYEIPLDMIECLLEEADLCCFPVCLTCSEGPINETEALRWENVAVSWWEMNNLLKDISG